MSSMPLPTPTERMPRSWQASVTDPQLLCNACVIEIVWAAMTMTRSQTARPPVRSLSHKPSWWVTPK
ncbi:MAG TPA: hypothetical protein V6D10_13770 [Trichocoleus sp.]